MPLVDTADDAARAVAAATYPPGGVRSYGPMRSMLRIGPKPAEGNHLVDRLTDGGRIVLIGSRTATGVAGKSQYAATKAALRALARSWAAELAPRHITVNVIEPGPTDTAMLTDSARAATPPVVPPLGRLIQPDEVAALAQYLLSDSGAMITGQHLTICGGASL
ncbi:SDR family NAD(P)-dependent oxidoreductase [Kribbella sp. NPDC054772]